MLPRVQEVTATEARATGGDATTAATNAPATRAVLDSLKEHRTERVLLLGAPGMGKTTILAHMASLDRDEHGGLPAVLVPLRDVTTSVERSVARCCEAVDVSPDAVREGRVRLLLDGVNELSTREHRAELRAFVVEHPKAPMVLTSRDADDRLSVSRVLRLLPLDAAQVERFVRAQLDPQPADDMLRQLRPYTGLRPGAAATIPMLLRWQCDAFRSSGALPSGTAETIERFVGDYERSRSRDSSRDIVGRWDEAMPALGAAMTRAGEAGANLTIDEGEARQLLTALLDEDGEDKPKQAARDLLDELVSRHLLARRDNGRLEMVHQLVQEHYAARWLFGRLPQLLDDPARFRREILERVGWATPLEQLMGRLDAERARRALQQAMDVDVLLAARMLGGTRPELHTQLLPILRLETQSLAVQLEALKLARSPASVPRVARHLQSSVDAARWDALEVLQQIGSKGAIDELAAVLQRDEEHFRRFVCTLLIPIANDGCVGPLLRVLRDSEPWARQAAYHALMGIPGIERHPRVDEIARAILHAAAEESRRMTGFPSAPPSPAIVAILLRAVELAQDGDSTVSRLLHIVASQARWMEVPVDLTALFRKARPRLRREILQWYEPTAIRLEATVVVELVDTDDYEQLRVVARWLEHKNIALEERELAALYRKTRHARRWLGSIPCALLSRLQHAGTKAAEEELAVLLREAADDDDHERVLVASLRGYGRPDVEECLRLATRPRAAERVVPWIVGKRDPVALRRLAAGIRERGDEGERDRLVEVMCRQCGLWLGGWSEATTELLVPGGEAQRWLAELGRDDGFFALVWQVFEQSRAQGQPRMEVAALLALLRPGELTTTVDELAEGLAQRCLEGNRSSDVERSEWFLQCVAGSVSERGAAAIVDVVASDDRCSRRGRPTDARAALSRVASRLPLAWSLERLRHEHGGVRVGVFEALRGRVPELERLDPARKAELAVDLRRLLLDGAAPAPLVELLESLDPGRAGLHVAEIIAVSDWGRSHFLLDVLRKHAGQELGWLRLLRDEAPEVRRRAANSLKPSELTPALWARLRELADDPAPEARVAVLDALARAGDASVTAGLIALLDDDHSAWRAAHSLSHRVSLAVFEALWIRREALAKQEHHFYVGHPFERLGTDDQLAFVRARLSAGLHEAREALGLLGHRRARLPLDEILGVLRRYTGLEPEHVADAVDEGTRSDATRLLDLLGDEDPRIRGLAARLLQWLSQDDTRIERLAAIIEDPRHPATDAAFRLLRTLPRRLEEHAIQALDQARRERSHAAWLLLKAGVQRSFPRILELAIAGELEHICEWDVRHAFEQLGAAADPRVIAQALVTLSKQTEPRPYREPLFACLAKAGGAEAVHVLLDHVEDGEPWSHVGEQIVAMSSHDAAAKDAVVAAIASGTPWALRALWMRRDETVVSPDDPLEDALLRASHVHDGRREADAEDLMLRAVDLLGRCEGPRAWARLVELRDHGTSYAVGREAIVALTRIRALTGRQTPPPGIGTPEGITLQAIIDELARVLHDGDAARELALRASFPAGELPAFDVPQEFWSRVVRSAADGKLVDGAAVLVRAASERYPGNQVFKGYLAQAGVASPGQGTGVRPTLRP